MDFFLARNSGPEGWTPQHILRALKSINARQIPAFGLGKQGRDVRS